MNRRASFRLTGAGVVLAALVLSCSTVFALEITSPSPNEVVYGSQLTIQGRAEGFARLRILTQRQERNSRMPGDWKTITDRYIHAGAYGGWEDYSTAGGVSGTYRIVAQKLSSNRQVLAEVTTYFRVDADGRGDGGGGTSGVLDIERPRSGEVVTTSRLNITGVALANREIRVRVVNSAGKWVHDKTVRSNAAGRWLTTVYLPTTTTYRADVEMLGLRGELAARRSVNFRYDPHGTSANLIIEAPESGETVVRPWVNITGTAIANRELRVRVVSSAGKWVHDKTVRSNAAGRWISAAYLPTQTNYRADVDLLSADDRVVLRRSVNFRYDADGGTSEHVLVFTQPREGQTVTTTPVLISGRVVRGVDVRLQVYDSRGTRVHYEMTRVDNRGNWSVRADLGVKGDYRAVADLLDERNRVLETDTLRFKYAPSFGGSGGSGGTGGGRPGGRG